MEYVISAGCLAAIAIIAVILMRGRYRAWLPRRRTRRPIMVVCIHCHGTGWIERRERTLEFTTDGFADIQRPSTMCETCGGTGQTIR